MNKNRIEVISMTESVEGGYIAKVQIRYIHDTVIQKVTDVKGVVWKTSQEALAHKEILEKNVQKVIDKVAKKIPTSKVFKHEFT